jgi:bifunctional DNA-binding transcriptional regulator/antitoxin component of YhaV-PrlF toxin-antitoxin module
VGYVSKVQVIRRGSNDQKQYYLICPAPLAQALEMEKGETIEWIVEDKQTLIIKRHTKKVTRG